MSPGYFTLPETHIVGEKELNRNTRRIENRHIKEALLSQIKTSDISLDDIVEWLWEDFGIRAKRDWKTVEKTIIKEDEITPQDLAVFMIDQEVMPEEGAWDVMPRRGLQGRVKTGRD